MGCGASAGRNDNALEDERKANVHTAVSASDSTTTATSTSSSPRLEDAKTERPESSEKLGGSTPPPTLLSSSAQLLSRLEGDTYQRLERGRPASLQLDGGKEPMEPTKEP